MEQAILSFISDSIAKPLLGSAIFTGILWFSCRTFIKNWLESRFNKSLKEHELGLSIKLEEAKSAFSEHLNRRLSLHQNELKGLEEIWAAARDAFNHVAAMSAFLQELPDLSRSTDEQLEEFFAKSDLSESQKGEIRKVSKNERTNIYGKIREFQRNRDGWSHRNNLLIKIDTYSIYIDDEILEHARNLFQSINAVLIEHDVDLDPAAGFYEGKWKERTKFGKEGRKDFDALGALIKKKLNIKK